MFVEFLMLKSNSFSILDRQEGGLEAFEEAGINLIPLTLKSDIAS